MAIVWTALVAAVWVSAPFPFRVRVPAATVVEPVDVTGAVNTRFPVPVRVVAPATTGWLVRVSPNAPGRSVLNVEVLFTDRVAFPVRKAGPLNVIALPARASGSGPPATDTGFVSVTAAVAWKTPLESDTGPVPSDPPAPTWSAPDVPWGVDRVPNGTSRFTVLVFGPE